MPNTSVSQDMNDYRVVVFGAAGVGKSSVIHQFVDGTFREGYTPTIEDTYRKVISSNKKVCTLQVTDTTGSHHFPAMQKLAIQRGHAFILMYSVSNKQSLTDLKPVFDEIVDIKGGVDMVPVMVVGNKSDDVSRAIPESEGQKMAKQWSCPFIETSAKNNYNIQELFERLLHMEKRRMMSLETGSKKKDKSKVAKRAENIKNKCQLM